MEKHKRHPPRCHGRVRRGRRLPCGGTDEQVADAISIDVARTGQAVAKTGPKTVRWKDSSRSMEDEQKRHFTALGQIDVEYAAHNIANIVLQLGGAHKDPVRRTDQTGIEQLDCH